MWPHDTAITVAGLLRYRHLPGAVRLAERLAKGLPDAVGAFDGRLPGLFCGTSPIAFLSAGALSDGMLAASVGKRRNAVAGAIVSGVDPARAPADADRSREPAPAAGQAGPHRSAPRSDNRADLGRGLSGNRPRSARSVATCH